MTDGRLQFVSGSRSVVVVEGATDRIFVNELWQKKKFAEPDFCQAGGYEKIGNLLEQLWRSPHLATIPSVKVIVDKDDAKNRFSQLRTILKCPTLAEGELSTVNRDQYRSARFTQKTIDIGALVLGNGDYRDLESLISKSKTNSRAQFEAAIDDDNKEALLQGKGLSKRLRFFERSISPEPLEDSSYHSLFGAHSDIDFNASELDFLIQFLNL